MNRVCLITGASRGLGLSLAKEYKNRGYTVIGVARRTQPLEELKQAGTLDDFVTCDLTSEASIDTFTNELASRHDHLDVLIHNAGIQKLMEITDSDDYPALVREEMQVNFLAPVQITVALLPLLIKSRATIIIIGSLLQIGPKREAPGYCASKAALGSWCANLREQLKRTPVKVVEVIPGLIKTTMSAKAQERGVDPDLLAREIFEGSAKPRIVLTGAKFPWAISRVLPGVVRKKLLQS